MQVTRFAKASVELITDLSAFKKVRGLRKPPEILNRNQAL